MLPQALLILFAVCVIVGALYRTSDEECLSVLDTLGFTSQISLTICYVYQVSKSPRVVPMLLCLAFGIKIVLRKPNKSKSEQEFKSRCVEQFELLSQDRIVSGEADLYWSEGYGRLKYLGLHDDPLAMSKPADYSLKPLELILPELSLEQRRSLSALSCRVLDLARAGSIRVDDSTLIRYLRSRNWDVVQTEAFLRETAEYRKKHDMNRMFTHWNLEAYEHCLRPWWLSGGFVGHGRNQEPIALERIGRCNFAKLVTLLPFEHLLKLDMVNAQRMLAALEEDAMRRGVPFMQALVIMDCQGFGLDQVKLKAARCLTQLIESRTKTLTEVTKKVLAVNAPPAAAKAWALMKHMLDPGTAAKVEVVTAKDTYPTLLRHIDEGVIPAYLGGMKYIKGDPECRAVLAPGGLPPPAALRRFAELIQHGDVEASSKDTQVSRPQPSRWRSCCG